MNQLAICMTAYQLFNTIQMMDCGILEEAHTTVLITSLFSDSEEITRRFSAQTKARVFFLQLDGGSDAAKLFSLYREIKRVKQALGTVTFDNIYFGGISLISLSIYAAFSDWGKKPFTPYEEGLDSYFRDAENYLDLLSFPKRVLHRLLLRGRKLLYSRELLLRDPSLICFSAKQLHTIRLPALNRQKDRDLLDRFNRIFYLRNQDEQKLAQSKCLFFDTYLSPQFQGGDWQRLNKLLGEISQQQLSEDFLVKLHPRTDRESLAGGKLKSCRGNGILWEVQVLNHPYHKEQVLMSVFSTAVFTPALLCQDQYTIVLLYRMILSKEIPYYHLAETFVTKFKRQYPMVRVYLPENESEFWNALSEIEKGNKTHLTGEH